jgi:hypothetical protein
MSLRLVDKDRNIHVLQYLSTSTIIARVRCLLSLLLRYDFLYCICILFLDNICITQMHYHADSFSLDHSWLYLAYYSSFSSASLWWLSDKCLCFSIWWIVYKESLDLHFVWYKEFSDLRFISLHDFYLQLTATWLIGWTFCDFD